MSSDEPLTLRALIPVNKSGGSLGVEIDLLESLKPIRAENFTDLQHET
jgi:hypothetical protein